MADTGDRVCPVEIAGGLDNRIRRWLQEPCRMLAPYVSDDMTALDFGCGPGFAIGARPRVRLSKDALLRPC
jgi:hypothetical protein